MKKDKAKIIKALGKVYAMTGEDISRMEYITGKEDAEFVKIYARDGKEAQKVDITYDDGLSMMLDVAYAVHHQLVVKENSDV